MDVSLSSTLVLMNLPPIHGQPIYIVVCVSSDRPLLRNTYPLNRFDIIFPDVFLLASKVYLILAPYPFHHPGRCVRFL